MIDPTNFAVFLAAGLVLNLTPGPDLLYVATRSLGQGRAAGVVSALGIATGGLIHTLAAAAGLSAILSYSALAFQIVKWTGAIYLVYLGIQMITAKGRVLTSAGSELSDLGKIYRQGVITNVLNLKVAIFFLSFLPQFTSPENGNLFLQIVILGTAFNITGSTVCVLVAVMCGKIGAWLTRHSSFWKLQRRITGTVFVALGLRLALLDDRG